eukprot:scaffold4463_cov367-Prasinococcus_capsulatus_cf.AAC.4
MRRNGRSQPLLRASGRGGVTEQRGTATCKDRRLLGRAPLRQLGVDLRPGVPREPLVLPQVEHGAVPPQPHGAGRWQHADYRAPLQLGDNGLDREALPGVL